MSTSFIKIIKDATEVYRKCINHPAMKDEVIGMVGEAIEKMDEEEMLAFDEWFFSSEMRESFTDEELKVVDMITRFMDE